MKVKSEKKIELERENVRKTVRVEGEINKLNVR